MPEKWVWWPSIKRHVSFLSPEMQHDIKLCCTRNILHCSAALQVVCLGILTRLFFDWHRDCVCFVCCYDPFVSDWDQDWGGWSALLPYCCSPACFDCAQPRSVFHASAAVCRGHFQTANGLCTWTRAMRSTPSRLRRVIYCCWKEMDGQGILWVMFDPPRGHMHSKLGWDLIDRCLSFIATHKKAMCSWIFSSLFLQSKCKKRAAAYLLNVSSWQSCAGLLSPPSQCKLLSHGVQWSHFKLLIVVYADRSHVCYSYCWDLLHSPGAHCKLWNGHTL